MKSGIIIIKINDEDELLTLITTTDPKLKILRTISASGERLKLASKGALGIRVTFDPNGTINDWGWGDIYWYLNDPNYDNFEVVELSYFFGEDSYELSVAEQKHYTPETEF